jgi:uncharacterized protein
MSLFFAGSLRADDFVIPPLTGPVVDTAHLIEPRATEAIETYLRRLRETGGTQVTVATVPGLGDRSIEEASIKIVEAWKLGSGPQDDGVLLLIAAKQRRMRIEVGQGREGVLPDATASRIVREVISPRMREGQVGRAVAEGVRSIVGFTDPDFARTEPFGGRRHAPRESGQTRVIHILVWVLLLLLLLKGNRMFGAGVLTGGMMRGPLGGWGGGSDGSWSGGGGGGGSDDSWSGGGGGFSGGGASGEW